MHTHVCLESRVKHHCMVFCHNTIADLVKVVHKASRNMFKHTESCLLPGTNMLVANNDKPLESASHMGSFKALSHYAGLLDLPGGPAR